MMLRVISIFTGLLLLIGQLYNSAVYAYYQYHFDYFANVLCENQDRSDIQCDGKCQLTELLAPSENEQNHQTPVFQSLPDLFPPEVPDLNLGSVSNLLFFPAFKDGKSLLTLAPQYPPPQL